MLASLRSGWAVRHAPQPLRLARGLDEAIAEAWQRPHPAWSATTPLHDARSRRGVREATDELRSLAEALRKSDEPEPATLKLCQGLLSDGFSSPLYGGDADALRREAGRLRFRVIAGGGDE